MSRVLAVAVLVFSLVVVTGCQSEVPEGAETKIAEDILSSVLGIEADLSTDEDVVVLYDPDGTRVTYTPYGSRKTVENFVLPVLPGWVPDDLDEIERNGSLSWLGRFSFKDDFEATAERYIKELEALGLTVEATPYEMFGTRGIILNVSGQLRGRHYQGMLTFGGEGDENGVHIQFGEASD